MKLWMKWPLLIAAVFVVFRIVLERFEAPEMVNNIFGVAWLYFLVPIYFALQITGTDEPKPYKSLFTITSIFALLTRLMVMPTYWLAYMFNWEQPRFDATQGGVVGEGVTPLSGYLIIPWRNVLIWVIFATLVGGLIGSIVVVIRRRKAAGSPA